MIQPQQITPPMSAERAREIAATFDLRALIGLAAEAGLLLSVTSDTVIRLAPPLILTTAEADEIVARLRPLVETFLAA